MAGQASGARYREGARRGRAQSPQAAGWGMRAGGVCGADGRLAEGMAEG